MMTNSEFLKNAKCAVKLYVSEHSDERLTDDDDVYVVWSCYILGSQKALLSTTLRDGMYYEVTYNKVLNELYLDAYKKVENKKYEV